MQWAFLLEYLYRKDGPKERKAGLLAQVQTGSIENVSNKKQLDFEQKKDKISNLFSDADWKHKVWNLAIAKNMTESFKKAPRLFG